MPTTNKIQPTRFKPLDLKIIGKMEMLENNLPLMSTCLPSSLYIWDTKNECQYLQISPSLYLLRRKDWMDNEKIVHAATVVRGDEDFKILVKHARNNNINELHEIFFTKPISSHLLKNIRMEKDLDHAEYIYDTSQLKDLEGSKYSEIRSKIRKFKALYDHELRIEVSPPDFSKVSEILNLYETWVEFCGHGIESTAEREKMALEKLISAHKLKDHLRFAKSQNYYYLKIKNRLAGFSVVETIEPGCAIGRFLKLNHNITGISEFFIHSIAKNLYDRGVYLLNAEEDLGNEGLRKFKEKMRPKELLIPYKLLIG